MMHLAGRMLVAAALVVMSCAAALAEKPARTLRIGVLEWSAVPSQRVESLLSRLAQLGYRPGETVEIHVRYAGGSSERAREHAAELVAEEVQVIVSIATPAGLAAKSATSTIPIVALSADPIGAGLLANLTRPEGNITGISNMMPEIEPKRIEILRELLPGLRTLGYLASSRDPLARNFLAEAERAAKAEDLRLETEAVGGHDEIDAAIARLKSKGVDALIVQPLFTLTIASASEVARICLRHHMPAIASFAYFPQADGLVSYGPDVDFNARAAAQYTHQLLTGTKVADLPVQQPTNFHLAINQKTAKQFGITVPTSILVRAAEVIE